MEYQSFLLYDTTLLKKQIEDNSKKIDEYLKRLSIVNSSGTSNEPESDC